VIPRSKDAGRIASNADVAQLELSDDDMNVLDSLAA
jgi:diketogulonate reductase-like aldo/keto reductase